MLGKTHATSGCLTWLGVCGLSTMVGHHPAGATVVVGAATCAGFALLPDMDHPGSLVARTFGAPSRWLAGRLGRGCAAVHAHTRTSADTPTGSGHRTVTHTLPFAVLVGLLVTVCCWLGGRWGVGAVVFVAAGLALRGLLPAQQRRRAGLLRRLTYRDRSGVRRSSAEIQVPWIAVAALVAAISCAWLPHASWAWVGLPAGLGCLTHCLGDALTRSGCPILWPVRVAGRRWYPVGPPLVLRFRTGGRVEHLVVMPLVVVGAGLAGWATIH